jgi:hypothetical protein
VAQLARVIFCITGRYLVDGDLISPSQLANKHAAFGCEQAGGDDSAGGAALLDSQVTGHLAPRPPVVRVAQARPDPPQAILLMVDTVVLQLRNARRRRLALVRNP